MAVKVSVSNKQHACVECETWIYPSSYRFDITEDGGFPVGPFCSEECVEEFRMSRLHDAAPDLLAACEAALYAFGDVKFYPDAMNQKRSDQFAAVLQLKAAIAKAKG